MATKLTPSRVFFALVLLLIILLCSTQPRAQQRPATHPSVPPVLLPEPLLDILVDEVSGEIALDNERLLASFEHKRPAEEYEKVLAESRTVNKKLKEYGVGDCGIEEVPAALLGPKTWNAEGAELWMMAPEKKRIIDLENVPACLAQQSQTSGVTAELVDVGVGSHDEDYGGKDVRGKVVLATGRAYDVHDMAVAKRGAKGVIIAGASNSDDDPDEVGRDTLARNYDPGAPDAKPLTFGFMISARQGAAFGKMLAAGTKVALHEACRTDYYPFRNELVWALLRGAEARGASTLLAGGRPKDLTENYKEARNILHQAFLRERAALQSTGFFAPNDAAFSGCLQSLGKTLTDEEAVPLEALAAEYRLQAACAGMAPGTPGATVEERCLAVLVPKWTELMAAFFDTWVFLDRLKGKSVPEYKLARSEDFEIRNFIDGARSILDIRNAVSTEFRPIPLHDVEDYVRRLEAAGMVTLEPGRSR